MHQRRLEKFYQVNPKGLKTASEVPASQADASGKDREVSDRPKPEALAEPTR